jgi:hypothetical protein
MLPLANFAAVFPSTTRSSTDIFSPFIKNGEKFSISLYAKWRPSTGEIIAFECGAIGRADGFNFLEKKSPNDSNSAIFFSKESLLSPNFSMNGAMRARLLERDNSFPSIVETIFRRSSDATVSLPITVEYASRINLSNSSSSSSTARV